MTQQPSHGSCHACALLASVKLIANVNANRNKNAYTILTRFVIIILSFQRTLNGSKLIERERTVRRFFMLFLSYTLSLKPAPRCPVRLDWAPAFAGVTVWVDSKNRS